MSFLAPAAFAFAAAIPVVIVFYLLKRKRVVKLVSSTLLWQKFLAETQASAPFQRLRHNWLLVLQILLLLLAVLALARPYFAGQTTASQLRVLILDASASMQATDVAPSRFENARAEALRWIDGLREGERMVIVQAAANAEVKQSETGDKSALRRALQACAPMDSPTRLVPALRMAESLVRDRTGAEIHLFSDGAVPELKEFENKALPLVFHRFGKDANNIGIVTLDVRAHPDDPSRRALFAGIANYSTNTVQTEVEMRFEGQLLETRPLTIQPGETARQVFDVSQSADGVFTLNLTGKDDLAADDQAAIVSLLSRPARVLLVTGGNSFLEKAIRKAGNVEVVRAPSLTDDARQYDIVVLDGVTPAVWPRGNTFAIRVAATNWFDGFTRVETPPVVDWKATHPLMRYVGLDTVAIKESLVARTPAWASAIIETSQGSMAVAGEVDRRRVLWLGFDTLDSNWPLRLSFPIFMANAVDWLNPAVEKTRQLLVKAGDPFRLPLSGPVPDSKLTLPDGTTRPLPVESGAREIIFGETYRRGVYHLNAGTNATVFCVNLLDGVESNIKPRDEIQLGQYAKAGAVTRIKANREIWRWLAGLALGVMLFEWWWYHKRTV